MQDKIKIVYTPLHGAGNMPVQRILKELGFENVVYAQRGLEIELVKSEF